MLNVKLLQYVENVCWYVQLHSHSQKQDNFSLISFRLSTEPYTARLCVSSSGRLVGVTGAGNTVQVLGKSSSGFVKITKPGNTGGIDNVTLAGNTVQVLGKISMALLLLELATVFKSYTQETQFENSAI